MTDTLTELPKRIHCKTCHHALRPDDTGAYHHSGPSAATCVCPCEGAQLGAIEHSVIKSKPKGGRTPDPAPTPPQTGAGPPQQDIYPVTEDEEDEVEWTYLDTPAGKAQVPAGGGMFRCAGCKQWVRHEDAQPHLDSGCVEHGHIAPDDRPPPDEPKVRLEEVDGIKRLTHSEMAVWKRCRRKWWLAFYRRLQLKEPPLTGARAIGTRLHHALAAYYSTPSQNPYDVLIATIDEDRAILAERQDAEGLDDLAKDAELALAMLEGYFQWVQETGADEGLQIVAPETKVDVASGHPGVNLLGKLDVRVRRIVDSAQLFIDHKSVGSLTEPLKTLHMNEQMLMYHLLEYLDAVGRGEHVNSAGGLYNMLRKVKRTARANPPFFDRAEVRHNRHEIESFFIRVHGQIHDILEAQRRLDAGEDHRFVVYPTPTGNCSWDCDFFGICPLFDDGSRVEDLVSDYYTEGDPHARYEDADKGSV